MQIIDLQPQHLQAAASMAAADHARERAHVTALPSRTAHFYLPRLQQLLSLYPGAAAIDAEGKLSGFIIGRKVPSFRSSQWGVHVPEWANAANADDRFTLIRQLYQHIAVKWVVNGCFSHAITLYAHDEMAQHTWYRTAFGMICGDGVRELELVAGPAATDIEIRQASVEDIDLFLPLVHEHQRYYPTSPLFMPLLSLDDREHFADWLSKPDHNFWLAIDQGEPVGYFESTPSHPGASDIIVDPGTCSICGAFVRPGTRKQGIGTALLARVVQWAQENGYKRCAVDYETHNLYGSRFWEKHFHPVAVSVMRHVDERVAWGNTSRPEEAIW